MAYTGVMNTDVGNTEDSDNPNTCQIMLPTFSTQLESEGVAMTRGGSGL